MKLFSIIFALIVSANSAFAQSPPAFYAHKGLVPQTGIPPITDVVITFPATKLNTGNHFNTTTSRFTPPAGVYQTSLWINVADPKSGGKYYATIRKNGQPNVATNPDAFELLSASRMSGTQDTVGTGVSGLIFANGTDYFEAVFHHSNDTGTRSLGNLPFETYWTAVRVSDLPPEEYSAGNASGPITAGNFTYVDRSWALDPGKSVTGLTFYTLTAGTYTMVIMRRDAAGSYEIMRAQNITHPGNGWPMPTSITPFLVPSDGKAYHLGVYTTGLSHMMFNNKLRSYFGGFVGSSGHVTMIEDGPGAGLYVLGVRAFYQ